jgi:hypothetical protein
LIQRLVLGLCVAGFVHCSSAPPPATQPLDLGSGGIATLSGDWAGTAEIRQAGKCSVGYRRDRKWQSGVLSAKERYRFRVEPDGSFTAFEILKDGSESKKRSWWGAISDDLKVDARRTSHAECQGVGSDVTTRLEGTIGRSTAGPTLEVSGQEDTCPHMGCVFAVSYRLVKQ